MCKGKDVKGNSRTCKGNTEIGEFKKSVKGLKQNKKRGLLGNGLLFLCFHFKTQTKTGTTVYTACACYYVSLPIPPYFVCYSSNTITVTECGANVYLYPSAL